MSATSWMSLCLFLAVLVGLFATCWWFERIQLRKAYRRIRELRGEQLDLRAAVDRLQWEETKRAAQLPKRGPGGRFLKKR